MRDANARRGARTPTISRSPPLATRADELDDYWRRFTSALLRGQDRRQLRSRVVRLFEPASDAGRGRARLRPPGNDRGAPRPTSITTRSMRPPKRRRARAMSSPATAAISGSATTWITPGGPIGEGSERVLAPAAHPALISSAPSAHRHRRPQAARLRHRHLHPQPAAGAGGAGSRDGVRDPEPARRRRGRAGARRELPAGDRNGRQLFARRADQDPAGSQARARRPVSRAALRAAAARAMPVGRDDSRLHSPDVSAVPAQPVVAGLRARRRSRWRPSGPRAC